MARKLKLNPKTYQITPGESIKRRARLSADRALNTIARSASRVYQVSGGIRKNVVKRDTFGPG